MKNNLPVYGGIEGGGTKFICALGTSPEDIRAEIRIETTTPIETLSRVADFFKTQARQFGNPDSIGFACFGPLDPNLNSATYGHILPTPKIGWSNANVVGMLHSALNIPIVFDTDVNGAALGEWQWGAAQGLNTFVYLTVGTGIGGGVYIDGKLLHGLIHPEMGHIPIPHDRTKDPFNGICPFHGDCFEGLACGPSVEKRWGQLANTLAPSHPAWDLEAEYIASALASYSYILSPERIILGGGIGQVAHLLPRVQQKTRTLLNNYIQSARIQNEIENYIIHPALGSRAGVLGAIALASKV